jgi:hypothetical protein
VPPRERCHSLDLFLSLSPGQGRPFLPFC